jgi:Chaperone for flagella basal body P-ring formation
MKPISLLPLLIVLIAISLSPIRMRAAAQACVDVSVQAQVEVPVGAVSLAELLAPDSCPAMIRSAARVHMGAAPLVGSPRVLEGEALRALLEKLGNETGVGPMNISVPERITIRCAASSAACTPLARRLASLQSQSSALHSGSESYARAAVAVRRGEKVTLRWDTASIRMTLSAVSLDSGAVSSVVRARVEPGGRVMRAVVVGPGQLRIGS